MRFRALETFESEETRSTYVAGLSYTVRPGNDILAVMAEEWRERSLIEYIDDSGASVLPSKVAGQGFVK